MLERLRRSTGDDIDIETTLSQIDGVQNGSQLADVIEDLTMKAHGAGELAASRNQEQNRNMVAMLFVLGLLQIGNFAVMYHQFYMK